MNYSPDYIRQLEKKDRYLEVINRFALQLLECQSVEEVVWSVAKNAIAELGYVDCVVYLYDSDGQFLIQRAAHGPKNPIALDILNPIKLKPGEGIVGHVASSGIGEIIFDTRQDPRYVLDDDMRLSEIAVPIMHNGKVIGVIDSEHPEASFYPMEDLEILTTIASITASKLVQSMYNEELKLYQSELEHLVRERTEALQNTLKEVEHQKSLISTKNRDLLDSINYAQRIQASILPSENQLLNLYPAHFVFFKPKDVVSGDFYWVTRRGAILYFAVADCTGHGVPGALLSIIGSSALDKIINEFREEEADVILEQLRTIIVETLNSTEGELLYDGMDIGLCVLNLNNGELNFSGANQCALIVRGSESYVLQGDKQSIGYHEVYQQYSKQTFLLEKGDQIFLSSDGYKDQFGGEGLKKFKTGRFRELLVEIAASPLIHRSDLLHKTFLEWKGDEEQLDDICIFGLEF